MDFVLVHGTAQSPAGWDLLRERLGGLGHRSWAVDLPAGRPRTGHAELSASDCARVAVEQTAGGVRDPVVVAHSGSGVLLPAIAEAVAAAQVVWLAAYVPDFGGERSLLDELQVDAGAVFSSEWIGVDPTADTDAARWFLFHDCAPDVQQRALSSLRKFAPAAAFRQVPAPRPPAIASTYVLPTRDRTLRPEWMRHVAAHRSGVRPREIEAGHCPHVSRPKALADLLIHAVR